MKAIVDDKIPFIRPAMDDLMDEVHYLPGNKISRSDIHDADVLIVRTRTHCNRELLEGSKVRFIATATIGFDHIDAQYLKEAGITWTNCPGCNATSVGQYVRNSLLLWHKEQGTSPQDTTIGVVGIGHVGRAVFHALAPLGYRILRNDPPLEEKGEEGLLPLKTLMYKCDVITLHTPLTTTGCYPTYHLIDDNALHLMDRKPLLINAARGEVVDNEALERALDESRIAQAVIDTWEHEPNIRQSLLQKVFIGTPHIAGYSADGKANATRMVLQALCAWMGKPMTYRIQPPTLPEGIFLPNNPVERALTLYNPIRDSLSLKAHPETFEQLRGNYPLRREDS